MEFLGQKLYHNQIIKEQYKNGKELKKGRFYEDRERTSIWI